MTDQTPEPRAEAPSALSRFLGSPRAGAAALAVSVVALGLSAFAVFGGGAVSDTAIRSYLLNHPEMLQEMSNALQARQNTAVADSISQRAAQSPALLAADSRDAAFGPVDAKVTVVEFFDFRCPGCKATAPEILRMMQANPDVRFVFKDWPILDRGDPSGPSHYAARAAQAAHDQGKYLPVFRALMAEGDLTPESIDAILVANGVDLAAARTAMASPDMTRHLVDTDTAAMALGLQATPTFLINGKAMSSIQPTALEAAIREARSAAR
ncbi:thioredoxin domain-containing protein [Brevundimonas sp. FT23028]|uniref:DsbA family protein n=1 Tax=Brevundimonas sp. FT23028 TaxID=3393748 RepID=UPI003B58AF30